jgi:hypothetical protein
VIDWAGVAFSAVCMDSSFRFPAFYPLWNRRPALKAMLPAKKPLQNS